MKKTNKGFSLVELIVVVLIMGIAIMAILAAALAPALIRYIDKSRRSSDLSNAGILQSAAQSAAADEKAYAEIAEAAMTNGKALILQANSGDSWGKGAAYTATTNKFIEEFKSTAGSKAPDVKLRKNVKGTQWRVYMTQEGGFQVYVSGSQLVPSAEGPWAN